MASKQKQNGSGSEKKNTGKKVAKGPIICPGNERPISDLCFAEIPDHGGIILVSSCLDSKPMLRNGVTGDWIGTFEGHKGAVWMTRLNRDATQAVTASADFSAKLWNGVTGEELFTWGHGHVVRSCAFSPDGKHVYTGGHEKTLRIFDLDKINAGATALKGHTASINSIIPLADPNLLITSAAEPGIKVWDLRTNKIVRTLDTGKDKISNMELSYDEKTISVCGGRNVSFFDVGSWSMIGRSRNLPNANPKYKNPLNCVSLAPDRSHFVTGANDELWVRGWNYKEAKPTEVFDAQKGHHGPVRCISFAPDGKTYASGSEDGTIRIWDIHTAPQS